MTYGAVWTPEDFWICKKAKLSLCLIKLHAMKTYGGVETDPHSSTYSLDEGREWSDSCSGRGKEPLVLTKHGVVWALEDFRIC